jgi:hypothetical protein
LLGVMILAACDGRSTGDAGRPDGICEGLDGGAGGEVPGPQDVVDEGCGIVMRYVIPLGDEGLDPYVCEGDTCWLGWHGYLDLSEDLYRQGACPGMLVQVRFWMDGEQITSDWMAVPASEQGAGVTGYRAFRVLIGHDTVPVDGEQHTYTVMLIPYAILPDGRRILHHVVQEEQRPYYFLRWPWRIPYNPSICGPPRWAFEQVVEEDPELYEVFHGTPPGLALVIDGNDRPHLLYRSSQGLAYITRQGTTWTTPEPVVEGKECHSIQLVPGVDGELHACTSCYSPGTPLEDLSVFYARRSAAGWILEPVAFSGFSLNCDLAADEEGRVHLVVGDWTEGVLHAERPPQVDTWTTTLLDPNGREPAIALDRAGRLHVVYNRYEEWDDAFYLVRQATGEWLSPEEMSVHLWGAKDLEVDADGNPHVAMCDSHVPFYVVRLPDGDWVSEMVDPGFHSGSELSMRLRETDTGGPVPLISYFGETWTLNYAERREFDWINETVDDIGDSLATSLDIDASGRPWIAYYSGLAGAIILATFIGE